jgi:hypothetical protein
VKLLAALAALMLCCACGAAESRSMETQAVIDDTLKADLETLRGARVFFGHQSVGVNILEGLAQLSREAGIPVQIGEGPVGANRDPASKFEDFARRAESTPAGELQVMAVKLCYADFEPSTDVDALIRAYRDAVARVRKAQPGVRIVHVTPPLWARPSGFKAGIKRMLGKSFWEEQGDVHAQSYRAKLLAAFPGEPVFDLSLIESTRPDGSREENQVDGHAVPMLWPGYTNDGGHLNQTGKRIAAKAFAHALAVAARS